MPAHRGTGSGQSPPCLACWEREPGNLATRRRRAIASATFLIATALQGSLVGAPDGPACSGMRACGFMPAEMRC
jgi:hypothetical protein